MTLAASTGPRQPRMAGTARLVVFPLWVGPTTTRDCAVSAASPESRATPGRTPSRRRPRGTTSGATSNGRRSRRLAQRTPRRLPLATPLRPRPTSLRDPGQEGAAEGEWEDDLGETRHAYPAVMAASVSTMDRSVALSRCWTRKDRWPTFHKAMPRRSCGSRSVSVADRESSSAAASSSPGDCA